MKKRIRTVGNVSQKEVLEYCIRHHISFAITKLPDSSENKLIVSNQVSEIDAKQFFNIQTKDGFILAPFSLSNEKVQFLNADYEIGESVDSALFKELEPLCIKEVVESEENYCADFDSYQKQFDRMFETIKKNEVSKVILSRIKPIKNFSKDLAADFYYNLSESYRNAYVFMFYSPQSGLWSGASPELLFKVNNQNATTVSLAATQKWNGTAEINWDEKEIDEQQIVSDFIYEILNKYSVKNVNIDGPKAIKAGKISHLKTQYTFPVKSIQNQLGSFINDIHPTPAVCGLPKKESMEIIQNIEKHQRSYYAGFLGRINKGNIHLFVNIRSLKFTNGGVDLYLGGGITAGSKAEKEWQETELKADTLLSVIEKVKGVN